MAPQFPSIQSFFKPESSSPQKFNINEASMIGDGFIVDETEASRKPGLQSWQPRGDYKEVEIQSIFPGPGSVRLVGRVVNLFDQRGLGHMPNSAKGCLRLMVRDDAGAILVLYICIHESSKTR